MRFFMKQEYEKIHFILELCNLNFQARITKWLDTCVRKVSQGRYVSVLLLLINSDCWLYWGFRGSYSILEKTWGQTSHLPWVHPASWPVVYFGQVCLVCVTDVNQGREHQCLQNRNSLGSGCVCRKCSCLEKCLPHPYSKEKRSNTHCTHYNTRDISVTSVFSNFKIIPAVLKYIYKTICICKSTWYQKDKLKWF